MIDVQKEFGWLKPNKRKKGIKATDSGRNLFNVMSAASKVDITSSSNAKNIEGYSSVDGRWVKFTEDRTV